MIVSRFIAVSAFSISAIWLSAGPHHRPRQPISEPRIQRRSLRVPSGRQLGAIRHRCGRAGATTTDQARGAGSISPMVPGPNTDRVRVADRPGLGTLGDGCQRRPRKAPPLRHRCKICSRVVSGRQASHLCGDGGSECRYLFRGRRIRPSAAVDTVSRRGPRSVLGAGWQAYRVLLHS
jgi:hypothetical protein